MRLLLGIFDRSFYDLRDRYNCHIYGDWSYDYKPTNFEESGVVAIINNGASIAEEIYFDITHIKFSLTERSFERSVTVSELYLDIKNATGDHFCAYKSIDQLKEWLTTEEIVYLKSLGYSVYLLELETALIGEYQIAYKKTDIITKQDITQLFV